MYIQHFLTATQVRPLKLFANVAPRLLQLAYFKHWPAGRFSASSHIFFFCFVLPKL